jgi:transcriptional regulator with XRE-family HTH domain
VSPSPLSEPFGALLVAARKKAGITQEELASRSGVDRTTVSQCERGLASPRLETVVQLAGGLDIDPRSLIPAVRWKRQEASPAPAGKFEPV